MRERESQSQNFILQHKKLLKGRRGSGKKQEEVEFSKSVAVIIGNKNDFKNCRAKVCKNKQEKKNPLKDLDFLMKIVQKHGQ